MALPKTFTEGEVLTAADLNANFKSVDDRVGANVTQIEQLADGAARAQVGDTNTGSTRWFGSQSSGDGVRFVAGSIVANVDSQGRAGVQHNGRFSTVLANVAMSGDYTNGAYVAIDRTLNMNGNYFGVRVYMPNGSLKSGGAVRIDYVVVGF